MSSGAIFVCNDCREAKDSSYQYPGEFGRDSVFELTIPALKASEYADRFRDMEGWIEEHAGHDVVIHSDAHGTFSSLDYDFDKREFVYSV
jgi:hypothetical protein